jgi:uncharacterized protein YecE (DUF72 family)
MVGSKKGARVEDSRNPGSRVEEPEGRRIRVEDSERRRIRVGVGGWTYEPWRDNFYTAGWPKTRELEYASRHLSAIEINATYHGTQRRTSFAKWREETPDDFVFSVKASRYATNRRVLAEAGDSIARFVDSGIAELGPKLGPIVWQFAITKRFESDDFEAFLALLPKEVEGVALRHVLDVRHASFMCPEYLALARRHGAATVFTDSDDYPSFADPTADFIYARLMRADAAEPGGYAAPVLEAWVERVRRWSRGEEPADLPRVEASPAKRGAGSREVFVYFINGAKERAPAAALALIERLK